MPGAMNLSTLTASSEHILRYVPANGSVTFAAFRSGGTLAFITAHERREICEPYEFVDLMRFGGLRNEVQEMRGFDDVKNAAAVIIGHGMDGKEIAEATCRRLQEQLPDVRDIDLGHIDSGNKRFAIAPGQIWGSDKVLPPPNLALTTLLQAGGSPYPSQEAFAAAMGPKESPAFETLTGAAAARVDQLSQVDKFTLARGVIERLGKGKAAAPTPDEMGAASRILNTDNGVRDHLIAEGVGRRSHINGLASLFSNSPAGQERNTVLVTAITANLGGARNTADAAALMEYCGQLDAKTNHLFEASIAHAVNMRPTVVASILQDEHLVESLKPLSALPPNVAKDASAAVDLNQWREQRDQKNALGHGPEGNGPTPGPGTNLGKDPDRDPGLEK